MVQLKAGNRNDAGAIAVIVAILSVVFFMLAALVVDLGLARDNRRLAQNGADAAALAAANALYAEDTNTPDFDAAVAAAKTYALENYDVSAGEWSGCTASAPLSYVPAGGTSCISFDSGTKPKNVLVVMPDRDQAILFGGVIEGNTGAAVGALAQARVEPGHVPICSFCVLKPIDNWVQNGNLTVNGGDVRVNGNLQHNPQGYTNVNPVDGVGGTLYISGNATGSGGPSHADGGTFVAGAPQVADPLAGMTLPFATQSGLTVKTNPCTQGPGIYGAFQRRNALCTLTPGLYVFTGMLDITGNANSRLVANGVTMYFTCGTPTNVRPCNPGQSGGSIDLTGNGNSQISPPKSTTIPVQPAELHGFSIVFDRENTATLRLRGNGDKDVAGAIYAKSAQFDIGGNGNIDAFSPIIIVGDVQMNGNGLFTVDFDPDTDVGAGQFSLALVK